jgi:hypothetical protein
MRKEEAITRRRQRNHKMWKENGMTGRWRINENTDGTLK